jgi:hypothetical protein
MKAEPIAVALAASCGTPQLLAQQKEPAMNLTSPAFSNGAEVPVKYTCEGKGVSPPLAWSGVPRNAKSLALIVDDPDAPDR